jgi:hypothetical protein
MPKEKVEFPINVAVPVSLAYTTGKDVEGRFGDQVFYTLADDRVMYVPPIVRKQIEELGIQKGQEFTITKCERKNGPRRSIEWIVDAGSDAAEPPGEPVVPSNRGSGGSNGAPHRNGAGTPPASDARGYLGSASGQCLREALIGAVDIAMATERYAADAGWSLRFSSDDVRAIGLSIFIQHARNGGVKWEPQQ